MPYFYGEKKIINFWHLLLLINSPLNRIIEVVLLCHSSLYLDTVIQGMLSLLGLITKNIIFILELSGFMSIIFQALVMIAVMVLRRRDPNPGNGVIKVMIVVLVWRYWDPNIGSWAVNLRHRDPNSVCYYMGFNNNRLILCKFWNFSCSYSVSNYCRDNVLKTVN